MAECELLTGKLGGARAVIRATGLPFLPGYTAPKILWLRRQEPANYRVNLTKQYVYTTNEDQVATIQAELKDHQVIYVGRENGFMLSGIPLGSELFITAKLKSNLDQTLHAIANIARLKNVQEKLILLLQ